MGQPEIRSVLPGHGLHLVRIDGQIHVKQDGSFSGLGRGVSLDTLLDGVQTEAEFVLAVCDGGYDTNLPLEDVMGGKAWVAFEFDGAPLEPEHGGPARLLVPHLYFWKSAKWIRRLVLMNADQPGLASFAPSRPTHVDADGDRSPRKSDGLVVADLVA